MPRVVPITRFQPRPLGLHHYTGPDAKKVFKQDCINFSRFNVDILNLADMPVLYNFTHSMIQTNLWFFFTTRRARRIIQIVEEHYLSIFIFSLTRWLTPIWLAQARRVFTALSISEDEWNDYGYLDRVILEIEVSAPEETDSSVTTHNGPSHPHYLFSHSPNGIPFPPEDMAASKDADVALGLPNVVHKQQLYQSEANNMVTATTKIKTRDGDKRNPNDRNRIGNSGDRTFLGKEHPQNEGRPMTTGSAYPLIRPPPDLSDAAKKEKDGHIYEDFNLLGLDQGYDK
ncbi:hypothetical protein L218DRAFT_951687 [Marasmius fiardii PR-910]|nr:hypothetical protein L218DRAFT_951687 [Marasmius fiardii PR-910]